VLPNVAKGTEVLKEEVSADSLDDSLSAVAVNMFMKETVLVVILSSGTDTERNKTGQLVIVW